MQGRTNTGGGGGGGLYYTVVCQSNEPAKKEGRIWVKSSVPMTQFEFVNPRGGAGNGTVVISGNVGGANPSSSNNVIEVFNTKRSGINHREKLTPTACNQVQNGAWAPVDAYVCHGDTWVQFSWSIVSLYNNGVWNTSLTGEWIAQGMLIGASSNPALTPHVAKNADNFRVYYNTGQNGSGIYRTGNKIDLTNFKTLRFEGEMGGGDNVGLNIWSNLGSQVVQNRVASLGRAGVVSGVGTLDVSKLTGNHYIGFNTYANRGVAYSYAVCKKLYLS